MSQVGFNPVEQKNSKVKLGTFFCFCFVRGFFLAFVDEWLWFGETLVTWKNNPLLRQVAFVSAQRAVSVPYL